MMLKGIYSLVVILVAVNVAAVSGKAFCFCVFENTCDNHANCRSHECTGLLGGGIPVCVTPLGTSTSQCACKPLLYRLETCTLGAVCVLDCDLVIGSTTRCAALNE